MINSSTAKRHAGFVALIGCPNVGKSTILNKMLNQKVSITSNKPQTTQKQILGIKTTESHQIVFSDTPGLHKGLEQHQKNSLSKYMGRSATQAISDVDLVLFVVAGTKWHEDDEFVLNQIKQAKVPCILVLNKVDILKNKDNLLPFIDTLSKKHDFKEIVCISALKDTDLANLETIIATHLPELEQDQEYYFDNDYVTDQNQRQQAAEIIREKVIRLYDQELPYDIAVEIEEFKQEQTKAKQDIIIISAIIWVQRKGQKIILIGKNGEGIKRVGENARANLEKLFGSKVHLNLWVKIKSNWSNDDQVLRSLGFDS